MKETQFFHLLFHPFQINSFEQELRVLNTPQCYVSYVNKWKEYSIPPGFKKQTALCKSDQIENDTKYRF
jgi:hypothetical protein